MGWESSRIQDKLYNDPGIQALVDTFKDNNDVTRYGIFNDKVRPKWFTGDNCITYYRLAPVDGGLEYGDYMYTVNCRARTMTEAEDLQIAVFNALNRRSSSDDGFIVCSALPVISPIDSTDNYNAPIEAHLKTR